MVELVVWIGQISQRQVSVVIELLVAVVVERCEHVLVVAALVAVVAVKARPIERQVVVVVVKARSNVSRVACPIERQVVVVERELSN